MEFEWDDSKAESNFKKHGIRFSEAVTIWLDDSSVEIPDVEHSSHEERWIRLGISRKANLLVVVYCEKNEDSRIRIISARAATKNESKQYNSR
ncbi:MAG: hypothetical protein A2622_10785 [Bdellovibrionales bacterium RIFCSPHIGHO2_01_FULL_40_29]|nr:MAG: hypothetical protein A2622_10785 [Bdellovibrionales bacterium RIFCSPHIGHO2_01_FULL_40_29]OFZ34441.1 MAG: hypothetical protein A3D17_01050 [Bdellovibrionales bacterium RIFCSPHIGHO2_02_FULL_40_15]